MMMVVVMIMMIGGNFHDGRNNGNAMILMVVMMMIINSLKEMIYHSPQQDHGQKDWNTKPLKVFAPTEERRLKNINF